MHAPRPATEDAELQVTEERLEEVLVTVHGSVCSFCVRLCCGPARCACQRCLVTVHLPR